MSLSAQVILAAISAGFSVILTGIVAYISWRGKGVLREHEKNTKFREFMLGQEEFERSEGELREINERFDEMRSERQREHAETREQLQEIEEGMAYLTQFVRNMAGEINRSDLDGTVSEPEEFDLPGTWRGENVSEGSDD